jgi:4,5-dihydroxyphthalate decarboxylase
MLKLTVGFSKNIRVEPLVDGSVKPRNLELQFVPCNPGELFYRNLKYDEFDVFEMSFSEYLMVKARGDKAKWQWTGLPIFLSKAFVWVNFFVNARSQINDLGDLKGKLLGIPDYPMTAALWFRKLLKELYGIHPEQIVWYNGRTKDLSHAGLMGLDQDTAHGVDLHWLTEQQTLDVMLDRGEIDAAVLIPRRGDSETKDSKPLDRYGGTPLEGNPNIRKLFRDSGRDLIEKFHSKTGFVPVNHVVVVQNKVLDKDPWVALELYEVFQQSKQKAYEKARYQNQAYLLFQGEDFKKQAEIFGEDPYPFGLKANRRMLQMVVESSLEQRLISAPVSIEECFSPRTWDS